ncbi:ankyrin repeat and sterile alpha motif domain-containing protein 1B isoform 1 [Cricetulus griseus]|nr:ankyrin repeat and sterile alpha motif domain-containing protein 1B isoform 1 [Cricetulus griseus]
MLWSLSCYCVLKLLLDEPKQRTSIVSSLDFQRMNHNQEYFEISTSTGCTSFASSPPVSPPTSSVGTTEVKNEGAEHTVLSANQNMDLLIAALKLENPYQAYPSYCIILKYALEIIKLVMVVAVNSDTTHMYLKFLKVFHSWQDYQWLSPMDTLEANQQRRIFLVSVNMIFPMSCDRSVWCLQ